MHLLRDERRRPHALEAGHGAGALPRAVHARRVELDDAVGVRQPAVADAVSSGSSSTMLTPAISASSTSLPSVIIDERLLDAGLRAAVLVLVAVGRRDDDRLDAAARHDGRRLR